MTPLIVVMALFVFAGIIPFYFVNVAGRRKRWRRYAAAYPDSTPLEELHWQGGFNGTVGSIQMWSKGSLPWFDLAVGESALHLRNVGSLFPSINRLAPISIPWEHLQICTVSKGNALTGSTLTFCFAGQTGDLLQAEDLGFQNQFKAVIEFDGVLKADRSDFEALIRRLGEMDATQDRITST